MKSTGILRRIDELGRIVLPIELRRTLDIEVKDQLEIFTEEDRIILKKHQPNCCFCGKTKDLREYRDRLICEKCLAELKNL